MATTAALKDLSFAAVDGGDASPSAALTTGVSITGSTIDLFDTVNNLLPDEVALRVGIDMTFTGGGWGPTSLPVYKVFAEWLTAATTGLPTTIDDEHDLVALLIETTTIGSMGPGTPAYSFKPANPRVFATKGRYLRLKYKINNAANYNGTLNFGADWARVFSKTEG